MTHYQKSNTKHLIAGIVIGGFIVYLILGVYLSMNYGRMINHENCDMSVDNLATLELHKDCDHG